MTEFFSKIKNFLKKFMADFPLIFAMNAQKVFWGGMVAALLAGGLIFYFNAYTVANADYDVFVTARKVNQELYDDIVQYIQEEKSVSGAIPPFNPFEK